MGPPTLPVLLAELGVFLSYILIIVDTLQSGGTDGSFCFVLCWCSTIFYCATNQHLHWYVRELCQKKTERETKAKGLSPHARDNQLQVGSSGGPIRPLVAEILIFYPHRQGGKITARPLFCGRPMDWVRAETEQSLRTKNTVRYGSYAEYLRLTTMFFFRRNRVLRSSYPESFRPTLGRDSSVYPRNPARELFCSRLTPLRSRAESPIVHKSRGRRMVSNQYIGRNHLALIHPEPRQNGGAKSMSIMRDGAYNYRAEHHRLSPTTAEDFEFEE